MDDISGKIRITVEEVQDAKVDTPWPSPTTPSFNGAGAKQWGNIGQSGAIPANGGAAGGSVFLSSWIYLGLAGFCAAFLAWAICEPAFIDDGGSARSWGNTLLFPLLVILLSVSLGVTESMVERSSRKAILRGIAGILLGIALGFAFDSLANVFYRALLEWTNCDRDASLKHTLIRGLSWSLFGISGGLVYGIVGRSWKKCLFGVLGGIIGAGIGGIVFDPIAIITGGGAISRGVGMIVFGTATGMAVGFVESALKDRWLYVSGGPLAGKQFILYRDQTRLGNSQDNEIYLFKDPTIQPLHAIIEIQQSQAFLRTAPGAHVLINGVGVQQASLRSGDVIQIGRYSFQYQEKQRAA